MFRALIVLILLTPLTFAQCSIFYPYNHSAGDFLDKFSLELPEEVKKGEKVEGRVSFTFGEGAQGEVRGFLHLNNQSTGFYQGKAAGGQRVEAPLKFTSPEEEGNFTLEVILSTAPQGGICGEEGQTVVFPSRLVVRGTAKPFLELESPTKTFFGKEEEIEVRGQHYPSRGLLSIKLNRSEVGTSLPLVLKPNRTGTYLLEASAFLEGENYTLRREVVVLPQENLEEAGTKLFIPGIKEVKVQGGKMAVNREKLGIYSLRGQKIEELEEAQEFALSGESVYLSRENEVFKLFSGRANFTFESPVRDISAINDSFAVATQDRIHYFGKGRWSKRVKAEKIQLYQEGILVLTGEGLGLYNLEGERELNLTMKALDARKVQNGIYVLYPRRLAFYSQGEEVWNFTSSQNFTSFYAEGNEVALATSHVIYRFKNREMEKKFISQGAIKGLGGVNAFYTGSMVGLMVPPPGKGEGFDYRIALLVLAALLAAGAGSFLLKKRRKVEAPRRAKREPEPPAMKVEEAKEPSPEVKDKATKLREKLDFQYSKVSHLDTCFPPYLERVGENILEGGERLSSRGYRSRDINRHAEKVVHRIIDSLSDWRNVALFEQSKGVEGEVCTPPQFRVTGVKEEEVKEKLEEQDSNINKKLGELTIYPLSQLWETAEELFDTRDPVALAFSLYLLEVVEDMLKNRKVVSRLRGSLI